MGDGTGEFPAGMDFSICGRPLAEIVGEDTAARWAEEDSQFEDLVEENFDPSILSLFEPDDT